VRFPLTIQLNSRNNVLKVDTIDEGPMRVDNACVEDLIRYKKLSSKLYEELGFRCAIMHVVPFLINLSALHLRIKWPLEAANPRSQAIQRNSIQIWQVDIEHLPSVLGPCGIIYFSSSWAFPHTFESSGDIPRTCVSLYIHAHLKYRLYNYAWYVRLCLLLHISYPSGIPLMVPSYCQIAVNCGNALWIHRR
jgi:hypothetical protein